MAFVVACHLAAVAALQHAHPQETRGCCCLKVSSQLCSTNATDAVAWVGQAYPEAQLGADNLGGVILCVICLQNAIITHLQQ